MKKRIVKLTEKDVESLVRKIIKEDDEEIYGHKSQDPNQLDLFKSEAFSFSFDEFDIALSNFGELYGKAENMLFKMEDLDLESTEKYDELSNLVSSISYVLDDFYNIDRELTDAYDDLENAKAEGDDEETEYLEGYIEELELKSMDIFRDYNEFKQELDYISNISPFKK